MEFVFAKHPDYKFYTGLVATVLPSVFGPTSQSSILKRILESSQDIIPDTRLSRSENILSVEGRSNGKSLGYEVTNRNFPPRVDWEIRLHSLNTNFHPAETRLDIHLRFPNSPQLSLYWSGKDTRSGVLKLEQVKMLNKGQGIIVFGIDANGKFEFDSKYLGSVSFLETENSVSLQPNKVDVLPLGQALILPLEVRPEYPVTTH